MNLNKPQILSIVHNALTTTVQDGIVTFTRFTAAQEKTYYKDSPDYFVRCGASANITLDFFTDADTLSFSAEFAPGSSQNESGIDLCIDGVLTEYHPIDFETDESFSFSLPAGQHRITVFLPWNAKTILKDIAVLPDSATVSPVEKQLRILAFGDSITQGYIARHPSASYVSLFAEALQAEVLNQGIAGYIFNAKTLQKAPDWRPDIITVAYGTNDFSHTDSQSVFQREVSDYIKTLTETYPNVPILGILPIYRYDDGIDEKAARKDYTFDEACEFIKSQYSLYPQCRILDGRSFHPRPADFYAADYLHPNDLGFSFYGAAVKESLLQLIKENLHG